MFNKRNGNRKRRSPATLPPTSGFGLRINEERFAADAKIKFDLKV